MKRLLLFIPLLSLILISCGNEEAKLREEYESVKTKYEYKKEAWDRAEKDVLDHYDFMIELKSAGATEEDKSYKDAEAKLEKYKAKAEDKKATVDSLMTIMTDLANKIGELK